MVQDEIWVELGHLERDVLNSNNTILGSFEKSAGLEDRLNWFIANYFAQFQKFEMLGSYYILDVFDFNKSGKVLLLSKDKGLIFNNNSKTVKSINYKIERNELRYSKLAIFDELQDKVVTEPEIHEILLKIDSSEDEYQISKDDLINQHPNKSFENFIEEIVF
ncbi:hypothetical protein PYI79_08275 [Staphylococcus epidermidis]|nr:hypothetical protein [Staphylococcus epidermidis]MDH8773782.1 hypothetical protein [Staphylococcus epidermidis]MDH8818059.1 hypothetical protein [Staphylococcus epidermidis]MDH8845036.1 hypothetical protein [Staphylococcus epidermidis]MDH8862763.1 hypothetical protein [Staphylococcus epidermidis]